MGLTLSPYDGVDGRGADHLKKKVVGRADNPVSRKASRRAAGAYLMPAARVGNPCFAPLDADRDMAIFGRKREVRFLF